MKKILLSVTLVVFWGTECFSRIVEGTVRCNSRGIENVVVSDGISLTATGRKGNFRMNIADDAEFVFIVTPAGYVADWSSGVPEFYQPAEGKDFFEFDLMEHTTDFSHYNMVVMADPQTHDQYHFSKFMAEPMIDLCETAGNLPYAAIGLTLGDISWDNIDILSEYKKGITQVGIPFYPVIGNHDHMAYRKGDKEASSEYRSFMGPENYAFFIGHDVVIVLDNIIYDTDFRLELGYADHVLEWVERVMKYVPAEADVFIAQHANCIRNHGRIKNLDTLLSLLEGHEVKILSGHTHINGNHILSEYAVEHNIAAICGAWWDTLHSIDGTPRGYKVYTKDGEELSWYYKPVDYDADYIAELFMPGETQLHPESLIVNVWDWDENWTVEWWQDGEYMGTLNPVEEVSPIFVREINDAYSSYGLEIPSWKRERPCGHNFAIIPEDGTGEVRISVKSRFGMNWERTFTLLSESCSHVDVKSLDNQSAVISLTAGESLLLPIEESAPEVNVDIDGLVWKVCLAQSDVEYYIPYSADEDIDVKIDGLPSESAFYKHVKKGNPSGAWLNPSPSVHFCPLYGWMNDPNGMFYKDGVWHIFYQYNPFGAKWGNMSWGHAVSRDLVNWKHCGTALMPDELGMIFSGSAVVDKDGTAGFGEDAVVAIYTSAGARQTQSIAYSPDGYEFVKYEKNPVLESDRPDFRDPKVIWHEETSAWIMAVSAGNAMEFYRSDNLKDWKFASRFGEDVGNHGGVWECPDLFPLSYGGQEKWLLISSCTRNPILGSGTQYFIGAFDGYMFTPDSVSEKWVDYGMDHYAAVTFSNAPQKRRIAMAWHSNWMYANELPLKGWRGMMTVPRELFLMEYNGELIMGSMPVNEVMEKCPDKIERYALSAESPSIAIDDLDIILEGNILTVRRKTGRSFSESFNVETSAVLDDREEHDMIVLRDEHSVEMFIDWGAVAMSFLTSCHM